MLFFRRKISAYSVRSVIRGRDTVAGFSHPARKPRCDRCNRRLCPRSYRLCLSDRFPQSPRFPRHYRRILRCKRRRRFRHPVFARRGGCHPICLCRSHLLCTPCTDAFLPDRRKRRQKHRPFRYRRAQPGTDRVSLSEAPRRPGKTACIHRILDHGKFKRHQPVFHRRKHRSVPNLSGWDVPVVPTDPPALSG